MKNLIVLSILFSGIFYGQKIKQDKIDKFSKKRTIKTSFVEFTKSTSGFLVPNNVIGAAIRLDQENLYLEILWYSENNPLYILEGDRITFLDNDGEKYEFVVASNSQSESVKQSITDAYYHRNYFLTKGDIKAMEGKKLTDIRFSQNGIYKDFVIPEKYQNEMSKLLKVYFDYTAKN